VSGFFKYEESLDVFNWELSQDTATIGGYLSQKACCDYGGRSWIAWFSTEIPFNDGPYKFNGLAGLIVKIYDSRKHYVFELTGIEAAEPDLMITILDYAYFETTKQKFLRAREASRNSIASIVKERGGDTYSQQTAARVIASRNNHIELK
jgi:GLPGLI family protein